MSSLATLVHEQDKLQEAEPLYREALEARRQALRESVIAQQPDTPAA
jgi:hypothetical protein